MARKSRIGNNVQFPINDVLYNWKIAIYTRLSVDDGDDIEQNSIGNQKKICMAYLPNITDGTLINIYIDNGFSGMNYSRPDFQKMYNAIINGDINCVIVKDVSRFGRHYLITSEYLQRTFPNIGVRFISVNDNYDSLDGDADIEGLLLPFKMILNDSYARDISKKIRSSISTKMNAGEFLPSVSSIPFGYIRNSEKNTFDVDNEAAHIVSEIFDMRMRHFSYNAIAKELNSKGIVSPGKLRFIRGVTKAKRYENSEWTSTTVSAILSDQVYIGSRIHGKVGRDRLGESKKRRNEDEWQIHTKMHQAIISDEVFYKVQEINRVEAERRNSFDIGGDCKLDTRELFKNKLYCGDCGKKMIGCKRNQRKSSNLSPTVFFQCYEYLHSNRIRCFNHYIPQEKLVDTLMNIMESQVAISGDVEMMINTNLKTLKNNCKAADILKSIVVKRKNIESKLEKLLINLATELIDRDEYEYTKSRYLNQIAELQSSEIEAEKSLMLLKEKTAKAQQWVESVKNFKKVPELTREIVELLVSRILIFSNGHIHVELNYENPYVDFMLEKEGE